MKGLIFIAAILALPAGIALAQTTRPLPYWVSLDEAEARSRTGPSTEFPVKWVYRRKHLPVKVVAIHGVWRKIEDMDGDQGWMHVRLLNPERTAIVQGDVVDMRLSPESDAAISWRAEPGVVGRISECVRGWCLFDVAGRRGYVPFDAIWGEEAIGPQG